MDALSIPCPFNDVCGGHIQLHPDIHVEHSYQIINGQECETCLTVTCELIAECTSCNFSEISDSDRRFMTFDQFYNLDESALPATPFEEDLNEPAIDERSVFYASETVLE